MASVKLSVSLPEDDVRFVDGYAARSGHTSRSSALHRAVQLLREQELHDAYAAAYDEWDGSADAALWEAAVGDGLA